VRDLRPVAAASRLCAPAPHALERATLDGALATMRAALAAGVERLVYRSSVARLEVSGAGASAEVSSARAGGGGGGVWVG
ncbi:NAD-dependent dehydratase, partial [Burkholderia pseudomallei]